MGSRHGQIFVLFGAMSVMYALRVNLSVAVVAMTDADRESQSEIVNWTTAEKGVLLSTFFYGYVVSALPSGFLSNRLKTRFVLSAALFISGFLTLVFPYVALHLGVLGCGITRAILGFFQGVLFPCVISHSGKWSVPIERARFSSFAISGASFGSAAMQSAAGLLAASKGGWPLIFYVSGGASIFWGTVCLWILRDSPRECNGISVEERLFIESSSTGNSEKWRVMPIPWSRIITSIPFWSAAVCQFSYCWGYWTQQTMLPTYMKSSFHFDIAKNGLLSSLPNLGMFTSGILSPFFAELVNKCFKLTLTFQRRLWNCVAFFGGAICFIGVGLFQLGSAETIILLVMENVFLADVHMGFMSSFIDLSPNFSAILVGGSNCVGQIASLSAPTITGFILTDDGTPFEWSVVFFLSSAIFVMGGAFFVTVGTAETQPWNDISPREEIRENKNVVFCADNTIV